MVGGWGGGGEYEQTDAKLSAPVKGEQALKAQIHYPVKDSGDLKMSNCLTLPYIFGSYLPIALIKTNVSILKIYKALMTGVACCE